MPRHKKPGCAQQPGSPSRRSQLWSCSGWICASPAALQMALQFIMCIFTIWDCGAFWPVLSCTRKPELQ